MTPTDIEMDDKEFFMMVYFLVMQFDALIYDRHRRLMLLLFYYITIDTNVSCSMLLLVYYKMVDIDVLC